MKIVFDTNVLISAFLTTSGLSEHVLSLGLKRHHVILSDYILNELERKLSEKLKIPAGEIARLKEFLKSRTSLVNTPAVSPALSFKDPKDIPILALCEISQAHYLVAGDKALLALKKHKQTLILSLREAAEIL